MHVNAAMLVMYVKAIAPLSLEKNVGCTDE
jgi:hypothetical protein